jgi:ABC-type uncharacterized transport system substrate-binding protein
MKPGRNPFRLRIGIFAAITALLASGAAPIAAAHPHVWIDARAVFKLDAENRVDAISIEWRFDEFFSAYAIEELGVEDESGISDEQRQALAKQYVDNLVEWHYMTELAVDDSYAELGDAEAYSIEIKDSIVTFYFTLPVVEPVDPRAHEVALRMYDPTYYISIEYGPDDPLSVAGEKAEECSVAVDEARPEMETVPLAQGGFTASDRSTGIGFLFAQTGRLHCE